MTLNHHSDVRPRRWSLIQLFLHDDDPSFTVLRRRWSTIQLFAVDGDSSCTPVEIPTTRHSDSAKYRCKTHFLQLLNRQTPYYFDYLMNIFTSQLELKQRKTIHNTVELKRIDRQLDVITTISVKSFLNPLPDDSTFYYRSISRHSSISFPSSTLQLSTVTLHAPCSFLVPLLPWTVTWHAAMFLPSPFSPLN